MVALGFLAFATLGTLFWKLLLLPEQNTPQWGVFFPNGRKQRTRTLFLAMSISRALGEV